MRAFFVAVCLGLVVSPAAGQAEKPRLVVLTDIGGDPDDQQSLVRLLLYANEFEIEGLIASAAGVPGELKEKVTRPELIRELVTAYGQVRENLARHADGYPSADELLSRIRAGNRERGRAGIGEGQDTEGSQWIIALADKVDPRPLCITIWGGQTDLAQALWRVRADRGAEGLKQFIAKLRVYDIGDQDQIFEWMWQEFPGMFYVLPRPLSGRDKREASYRGMYLGGDESLVSREWMEANIRQNHGPLGALYPPETWTAPNPHSAIKEGDTPSWFFFLPQGLGDAEHPEWGGFGGRFARAETGVYLGARDRVGAVNDVRATVWRWRSAFQADFQARLDWCVSESREKANHAPVAALQGDRSRRIIHLAAKAGERVELSAAGSEDPDKQAVIARWFVYPEAGTYDGEVKLTESAGVTTSFLAPAVSEARTIHVILEVGDAGSPKLVSFRRAVVAVSP